MRPRPQHPPDFIAQIRLDPDRKERFTAGRLMSGFMLPHDFHHPEGGLNDALHFLLEREDLPLGVVTSSEVWLLAPERQYGRFYNGFEFNIHSANVVIGNGFITQVINEKLAKRT